MEKEKKKIFIRTDGNAQIGMGHLMRCLSIAFALRDAGGEVCFLLADDTAAMTVEKAGFLYEVLGKGYRRMEEELAATERILRGGRGLREDEKCLFLVDSYSVTDTYLLTLQKWGKVAYMDDVNAFPYPADLIINGNIYGAEMDYSACGARTQVLGGPAYAPLRPEYAVHRGERQEEYILVTTGGSDPYRLAAQITESLLKEPWMEEEKVCAVCGRFSASIGALRKMEKQDARLCVLTDVPDMWSVMNGAKFAITAAGGTMQELACLGVPMIGFSFADNQRLAAQTWKAKGYSCYGGDYLSSGPAMIGEICAAAQQLCGQTALRDTCSHKLMELVDGEGSRRIAEKLMIL